MNGRFSTKYMRILQTIISQHNVEKKSGSRSNVENGFILITLLNILEHVRSGNSTNWERITKSWWSIFFFPMVSFYHQRFYSPHLRRTYFHFPSLRCIGNYERCRVLSELYNLRSSLCYYDVWTVFTFVFFSELLSENEKGCSVVQDMWKVFMNVIVRKWNGYIYFLHPRE